MRLMVAQVASCLINVLSKPTHSLICTFYTHLRGKFNITVVSLPYSQKINQNHFIAQETTEPPGYLIWQIRLESLTLFYIESALTAANTTVT